MPIDEIPVGVVEVMLSAIWLVTSTGLFLWLLRTSTHLLVPIMTGFFLRIVVAIIHRNTSANPEGRSDAVVMENTSWLWAQDGCLSLWHHFDPGQSYVHSWIMANLYACTERAPLMFQLVNATLGMIAVIYIAKTAQRIWTHTAGVRAAWLGALFPALIVYSTVPLREAWIYMGLAVGLYHLVCWVQDRRAKHLIGAIAFLAVPSVFHGGMVAAFLTGGLFVLLVLFTEALRYFTRGKTNRRTMVAVGIVGTIVVVGAMFLPGARFSSIGGVLEGGLQIDLIAQSIQARGTGSLAYASIPEIRSLVDLVLAAPLQAIRLLLGPFPWEVRGTLMVVVMIESWAYLALAVPVLFRIRPLLSRPEVLLVLFALVALAIAFGLGSANYGTSMRHRAKLVGLLIVLFAGCRETRRTPRARRATTRKRAQANG